ncbi:glycosyltransferase family 2 protein [Selenomonas caprae]|uniref:Glycosyltransferase family 2 protein n=1 Tax=Selenomonas caprae TaxID=2606905 RepID=A0A5D6WRG5_9FIRM|nr:glycosyltransferase family 2 protein [Selenomonas caprae]TYZ28984.1 glycosyltransferase family 2 protein [Selenomonas caprae]
MRKTSIIILSYNTLSYTQFCIESIRAYTRKNSYEIIVVDNASTDGSLEWLKEQHEIKLIANPENVGFPAGCNQGMKAAAPGNDLLLLNSDTIVTPHWLDNLQQALYSGKDIGAVSCVTNNCSNGQSIAVDYQTVEELQQFATGYNHSDAQKWYSWPTLVGFCFLLKRVVYDKIGGMDERYSPGNYEDDDYSYTIRQAGYRLLLCADTFIHHFGSASFKQALDSEQAKARKERFARILEENEAKFMQKWQVSPDHKVFHGITDVLQPEDAGKHVLLVRCSVGLDLCNLKRKYPQLHLSGVVLNVADKANAVQDFPIRYVSQWGNISAAIPARQDIILVLGNVRTIPDSKRVLLKLARRLKPLGKLYYYDEQHSYCEQRNVETV